MREAGDAGFVAAVCDLGQAKHVVDVWQACVIGAEQFDRQFWRVRSVETPCRFDVARGRFEGAIPQVRL